MAVLYIFWARKVDFPFFLQPILDKIMCCSSKKRKKIKFFILGISVLWKKCNFLKKIFCQNKKWLYFCSRFPPNVAVRTKGHWNDEKIEIACVTPYTKVWGDTKTSQKVKNEQFLQWRVWSWLRMNASGRLNTCKSRGNAV